MPNAKTISVDHIKTDLAESIKRQKIQWELETIKLNNLKEKCKLLKKKLDADEVAIGERISFSQHSIIAVL